MSQRECAGLNRPPLGIAAEEPVRISPEAVRRAGPIMCACRGTVSLRLRPSLRVMLFSRSPVSFQSRAAGVTHPASVTVDCRSIPPDPRLSFDSRLSAPRSLQFGVGHPVESLADVRRPDARSAQIDRPCGVTLRFQVSEYNVEPSKSVR